MHFFNLEVEDEDDNNYRGECVDLMVWEAFHTRWRYSVWFPGKARASFLHCIILTSFLMIVVLCSYEQLQRELEVKR